MRKLASIKKVTKLSPIEGKDLIELAEIGGGWYCIVKKGDFNVNDLCVYIEPDSVLPIREEFEFLRKRCFNEGLNGFRIKTMKMGGVISQGIVFPVSIVPENTTIKEDIDLTEILQIRHYDPESSMHNVPKKHNKIVKWLMRYKWFRTIHKFFYGKLKGRFPSFIAKTDEERIQNLSVILKNNENTYYVCEKLDGQSVSFFTRKIGFLKSFGVCSRNIWLKTPDNSNHWETAKKFNVEKILKSEKNELTMQGEICGPGIQKNKYNFKSLELFVFNIINNRTGYHFSLEEMEDFCKKHNLKFVPVLEREFKLPETVNDMVEYAKGKSVIHDVLREGVVVRRIVDGKKITSFKAINPEFLLKHDT